MTPVNAKENILKKIRTGLQESVPQPFPEAEGVAAHFPQPADDLAVVFGSVFTGLGGHFSFNANAQELENSLRQLLLEKNWTKIYCPEPGIKAGLSAIDMSWPDLSTCDAAITGCTALVARTGSIVLSSAMPEGRTASVYAPVHICVAPVSAIVYDIKDGIDKVMETSASFFTFATGPSRTADIEKTLVTGVHGPKEVYCFLVDQ